MNGEQEVFFTALSTIEISEIHPDLNLKECSEVVHLVDENNQVHRGSEVIEYLIKFYPQVKKLSWLIDTDGGKKAVEAFHGAIDSFKHSRFNVCPGCSKK